MPGPIRTLTELIQTLLLQKENLTKYQTEVGARDEDITAVTNAYNNLTAMDNFCEVVDASKKTCFQIKQAMFNGDPDEALAAIPDFPDAPTLTAPLAGEMKRFNERNARFKTASGYNHDIGVALGIAGGGPTPPSTPTKPTIDVFAAESGKLFSVVVHGRGKSDMWQVLTRPVGETAWTVSGSATGKSIDITYNPGGASDTPVQLQVRVQLLKSNENYGLQSDIVLVTVNP